MKVSERKEFVGEFYLPSNPGCKIPGVLKIGLNGESRLETFGNFESHSHNGNQWDFSLINGEVGDVGRVTLIDCYCESMSSTQDFSQGKAIVTARFVARCVLCNLDIEYASKDEIKFNTLRFSVEHLNRWLGFLGMKEVGGDIPDDIAIKLDDASEVRFVFEENWRTSKFYEVSITQLFYIRIKSEQSRALSYFIDLIDRINVFLCMALDEIACIKDVMVDDRKNDYGYLPCIEIYYKSFVRAERSPRQSDSGMLFAFDDIKESMPAILNGWIKNYGAAHITYSSYLSCRMGEIEYVENMLLSLVQTLESLYNKVGRPLYDWPRNKGLDGKLRKILAFEEGLILDDQYLNEVIGDIVGIRNYLTHHGGPASEFKEKSEDLRVVATLCRKLEVAIQLHFVKQVELSAPETRGIFKMAACRLESTFRDSCYEK